MCRAAMSRSHSTINVCLLSDLYSSIFLGETSSRKYHCTCNIFDVRRHMGSQSSVRGTFRKQYAPGELDAFYPTKPEYQDDGPKTRFRPRVGRTLSERRWHAAFSEDGHLDIAKVLRRIQLGGVHPSVKGVVWEFLLGCFDPNSSFDDRNQLRQQRRKQYEGWRDECQKLVPVIGSGGIITTPIITENDQQIHDNVLNRESGPDGNNAKLTGSHDSSLSHMGYDHDVPAEKVTTWKLILHQIGLDVVRTDQALIFYQNEANQAKLWNVLSVYAWVDNDIGYCQGMNDICSPMVVLCDNEGDAFWCFERAMRRMRENFRCDTKHIGVQSQLDTLANIIKAVDPKLHDHLEEIDGGQYLFAFRMLMVNFRREFPFVDVLYLWEFMWAMEYNPNIFRLYEGSQADGDGSEGILKHCGKFERKNVRAGAKSQISTIAVYLAANVLVKNKKLLQEAKGLDDVVKIVGETIDNLDAKRACRGALRVHRKYLRKARKS